MDALSAKELAAAMAVFASLIETLGAGGVLGLLIGSPLLMVGTFSLQGWWTSRRLQNMLDVYRNDGIARAEENRRTIYDLWEKHRQSTEIILKDLSGGLAVTTQFYRDNVELVNDYSWLADGQHDLIISNIRSLEKIAAGIEMLCKSINSGSAK